MGWKFFKTYSPRLYAQNFKKGFSGDYGIKMSPGKLHTLGEQEWATVGVDWPSEGALRSTHCPVHLHKYGWDSQTP